MTRRWPLLGQAAIPGIADDDAVRSAWISEDGLYRYTLNRTWGTPGQGVVFVMLNPSTADHQNDDPTIRRCRGFARTFGYGALTVVNLYAYRATKPADLWQAERDDVDIVGPRNNALLRDLLRDREAVIAAWGANARPDRVEWLAGQPGADRLLCLGTTKDGHPRHPLYVRGDAPLSPWRMP